MKVEVRNGKCSSTSRSGIQMWREWGTHHSVYDVFEYSLVVPSIDCSCECVIQPKIQKTKYTLNKLLLHNSCVIFYENR